MSSRRRKQEVREIEARVLAKFMEERRPYEEISALMQNGTDEELAARISRAVAEGCDIAHHIDKYGYSFMHTAAELNRPAAIEPLIRAGLDVNDRGGKEKGTPLHTAVISGSAEAVRELIRLGADVNANAYEDSTALHYAAYHADQDEDKYFEIIKALIDAGANPHAQDVYRIEPVHCFKTQEGQRRFLSLIGEDTEKLPTRYMLTYDYDGRFIIAVRGRSL